MDSETKNIIQLLPKKTFSIKQASKRKEWNNSIICLSTRKETRVTAKTTEESHPINGGAGQHGSGPQGPQGPQGPHGPQGPQGPHGPQGPQGPHGSLHGQFPQRDPGLYGIGFAQ
uniref:Collagen IV NC1 domain-containing protein n=1 Tax=Megaselia scalaris TaxID=36166 RepID=T1GPU7_MEGSC